MRDGERGGGWGKRGGERRRQRDEGEREGWRGGGREVLRDDDSEMRERAR